jgi:hypothetical protein
MCAISMIIALLGFTALYHMFAGPQPGALQVAHTYPRITTPIHQQFIPNQPLIVQDPFNRSKYIEIAQTAQGSIYDKPSMLKRYLWRTLYIRPCDEACQQQKKKEIHH